MPRDRSRRQSRPGSRLARTPRAVPRRGLRPGVVASERAGPDAAALIATLPIEPLQTTLVLGARGNLVIPRAMRGALGLDPGGSLIAQLTPEGVLLRPAITFPMSEAKVRQVRAAGFAEDPLDRFLRKRRRRAFS